MKALALWQPWASLVVLGAKTVETRGWAAPPHLLGETVAIHATLTKDHLGFCEEEPFSFYVPEPDQLPLGAIVGTVKIKRTGPITEDGSLKLQRMAPEEYAFGAYSGPWMGSDFEQRYAIVLEEPFRLPEPIPCKGMQGRYFNVPPEIAQQVQRALDAHNPQQGSLL